MSCNHKPGDLQVWWIPQVPGKPFEVPVQSVQEGVKIMDVLADYDQFQLDNNIKPDYANVGGIRVWCEDDGEGEPGWNDWFDEETGIDDPREWLELKNKSRTPQLNDSYYPHFESDWGNPEWCQELKIQSVEGEIEDSQGVKGFNITANDWIGYDCFWSDKLQKWVYSLD